MGGGLHQWPQRSGGGRMGNIGAIIEGGQGTSQSKMTAIKEAGAQLAEYPLEVLGLVREQLTGNE